MTGGAWTEGGRPEKAVAYLVRSFPRLSQTFVLNEILGLERAGVRIRIFAITDPHEPVMHPEASVVAERVVYLGHLRARWRIASAHASAMLRSPLRYVRALRAVVGSGEVDRGYRVASRYRCLGYAARLASEFRRLARTEGISVAHVHAHFAHDPAFVAMLTHLLTGTPYSFTAHARDLYQVPSRALGARVEGARAVVTCCRANLEHLLSVLPAAARDKIHLVRHGVDLREFPPPASGARSDVPVLLSVGRLVEKKGFDDLLTVCRDLAAAGLRFRCRIVGEGPERDTLVDLVKGFGLGARVELAGPRPRREILAAYRGADVFILLPYVTGSGDRDGIPNVLVEAMASGLPVVTTAVGGVPELVTDGVDGLTCAPRDVGDISRSVATLIKDPVARSRLGAAARRTIEQRFDARVAVERLAGLFDHPRLEAASSPALR